jgi:hypothetical protein
MISHWQNASLPADSRMSTVAEIESALKKLPVQQAQEIARWLDTYLKQTPSAKIETAGSALAKLPDYAARRRQVFGDQVLPNMVLAAGEEERW